MGREVEKEEEDVEITYNKLSSRQTSRAEQSRVDKGRGYPERMREIAGSQSVRCRVVALRGKVRYTLKERLDLEV